MQTNNETVIGCGDPRLLVDQIDNLISIAERVTWTDDTDEAKLARGAIERAQTVAKLFRYNGPVRSSASSSEPTEQYRVHVENWAVKAGWTNKKEGPFEFAQRTCYRQGWDDAIESQRTSISPDGNGDELTMEQVRAIIDSITPGDGWGGDEWDFATAQAVAAFVRRAAAPVSGQGASIDTAEFRKLTYAYSEAVMHGTVPQTSNAWGALVQFIDSRPRSEDSRAKDATKLVCLEAAEKLRTYVGIYTGDKQARRLVDELTNIADALAAAPTGSSK